MDNRQLLTTMSLGLLLFFVFTFLDPFGMKQQNVNKPAAVAAAQLGKRDDFFQPTGNARQFFSLGSLAKDAKDCLLVTFDNQGAGVRRIELVQRDAKGRFITREVDNKSGYLGYLELEIDSLPGSIIRVIPNGSPLANATSLDAAVLPVQVGDRLISVNGLPVESDAELETLLADTRGGQTFEVVLARRNSEATTVVDPVAPAAATEDKTEDKTGNPTGKPTGKPTDNPTDKPTDNPTQEDAEPTQKVSGPNALIPNLVVEKQDEAGVQEPGEPDAAGPVEDADPSSAGTVVDPVADALKEADSLSRAAQALAEAQNWTQYQANVTLAARPKKLLGPEYRSAAISGPYPSTLEMSLLDSSGVSWADLDQAMRRGNWAGKETTDKAGRPCIEFAYQMPKPAVKRLQKASDFLLQQKSVKSVEAEGQAEPDAGTIRVVKRYRLPEISAEDASNPAAEGYHVEMDLEIFNETGRVQELAYKLNGPVATSIEGWWYQIKLHGGFWNIGYSAGARDLVASTEADPYEFFGRGEIVAAARGDSPFPIFPAESKADARTVRYAAVDTLYFASALLPAKSNTDAVSTFGCYSGFGGAIGDLPAKGKNEMTTDVSFRIYNMLSLDASIDKDRPNFSQSYRLFAGPKRSDLLSKYGLDDTVTFGWFAMFSAPLCWLLHLFYAVVRNYGVAIIMLTVLVRLGMMPISRKAVVNAQMMQALQPELKKIKEIYPDNMEKQGVAQRELFRRFKYNPLGGCLIMFVQLPIFIGLYRGLSVDFELRDQALIPGLDWCTNLSGPDQLFNWSSFMPEFLAGETGWLGPYFNVLPLVTIVLFIIQQKMFTPPPTDEQQVMMQRMMSFMMIFMGFMFFKVPAGLCIYFITSSIWGLVERVFIPKPTLSQDVLDGIQSEIGAAPGGAVIEGSVKKPSGVTKIDEEQKRVMREKERERERRLRDKRREP